MSFLKKALQPAIYQVLMIWLKTRHCEERSDEAIQSEAVELRQSLDCFVTSFLNASKLTGITAMTGF